MPWGDRTGPMGMGPMTGRGAGYCTGNGMPGYMNPVPGYGGRGWGRGRGGGRGWRYRFWATGLTGWQRAGLAGPGWLAPPTPVVPPAPAMGREQEIEMLKNQAAYFEEALGEIRKRITELDAKSGQT